MATEHQPSRSPVVGRLAGVALIILVVGGSVGSALLAQNNLTAQAQAVLDNAGIPADAKYSGLDAEISGWASEAEMARGADLIRKIPGTRSVKIVEDDSADPTGGELDPTDPATTSSSPKPSSASPTTPSASPSATPSPTTTAPLPDLDILFAGSSASLSASQAAKLRQVATWMNANPSARVEVRGHTDNGLTASQREKLSRQRAQVVVTALEQLGIGGQRLVIRAMGSTDSAANNDTAEGRAKNRRVDFAVVRS